MHLIVINEGVNMKEDGASVDQRLEAGSKQRHACRLNDSTGDTHHIRYQII